MRNNEKGQYDTRKRKENRRTPKQIGGSEELGLLFDVVKIVSNDVGDNIKNNVSKSAY